MNRLAPLALATAAACGGQSGTIQLELTTAPGSTLLDGVQTLRVTLSDPPTVVVADRTANGFDLALDVEANGSAATLTVEGLDAGDSLVAAGSSPPFAVSAIDARIVIYMAPPLTIEPTPSALPGMRTGVASSTLSYGFAVSGGEDDTGTRTDTVFVYNTFDHTLLAGKPMPEPRAFQTAVTGTSNRVYLFGGIDADGNTTGSTWVFDTNASPNGSYNVLVDHVELARSAALGVTLAPENFLLTGVPPVALEFGSAAARGDIASLPSTGAAVAGVAPLALFAGDPIVRLNGDSFDTLADSAEVEATAAPLPDGRIVFAGVGATFDLLVVDPVTGSATRPAALSTARAHAAVAATSRFLVVAGGLDGNGAPVPSADLFDAGTLAPVATVSCLARSGAAAHVLPNGQIAIVGGEPANDAIELFTPPPE